MFFVQHYLDDFANQGKISNAFDNWRYLPQNLKEGLILSIP
jgi:hypothetical protein